MRIGLRVVDSVGWIAYFKGEALADVYEAYLMPQSDVICPTVIIYEVCKKMENAVVWQAAAMAVAQMRKARIISLDDALATASARTSIIHNLPMADSIIYTTAMLYGAALVTSDAHLRDLPGVEFIHLP